jgi:hypothetical protein
LVGLVPNQISLIQSTTKAYPGDILLPACVNVFGALFGMALDQKSSLNVENAFDF